LAILLRVWIADETIRSHIFPSYLYASCETVRSLRASIRLERYNWKGPSGLI